MPENGLIGDTPMDLPVTRVPDYDLSEEKAMARFSQSAEYKRLETYIQGKIAYYQEFLPGNLNVQVMPSTAKEYEKLGKDWVLASTIIAEFQGILDSYTQAQEVVKNARRANA